MKHRLKTILVLLLLSGGSASDGIPPAHAASQAIVGVYTAGQGTSATLEVRLEGAQWVVLLSGGSTEAAGAAAPADCYIRALGTLQGNILVGQFTAITSETFAYSQAQAEKERRMLKVMFGPNTAEVIQAETVGYCGVGSNFVGHYRRNTPP
jgi:hypothetical protein